jgi:hypothetical protein
MVSTIIMENECQWVLPNDTLCGKPTKANKEFCFSHEPLARANYERPKPKLVKKKEREPEILAPSKTKTLKRTDFPSIIDGQYFETIDEYYQFQFGCAIDEMEGTDQEYFSQVHAKETIRAYNEWQRNQGNAQYSFDRIGRRDSQLPTGRSLDSYTYTAPKVRLERNAWKLIDSIMHMRYLIVRLTNGNYHAVWVSLSGDLNLMMEHIMKQELPLSVTHTEWGRFHTSKSCKNFDDADWKLNPPGESVRRTKERIQKVLDPNWIPPNLRKAAKMNQWHLIPENLQAKLKVWVKEGCPGWNSWTPSPTKKKKQKFLPSRNNDTQF